MIYDCPRFVGNPFQYRVETKEDFREFVKNNNGKAPCFTSHNAHPDREHILHRYIPFDFDSEDKLENALADVLSLLDWAEEHRLGLRVNFSGRRGFHAYFEFEPSLVKKNNALKDVYLKVQRKAKEEAQLRTSDPKLEGDIRRIMRIIGTVHEDTDLYCFPLDRSTLERADMKEILELAESPEDVDGQILEPVEALHETVGRMELDLSSSVDRERSEGQPSVPYKDDIPEFVKAVIPRPCIHNGVMEQNPAHMIRFEACAHLVNIGYGLSWLLDFFDMVAEEAKWVDRHRVDVRNYQVQHIWRQGEGYYRQHSCHKIRAEGHCIGEDCPMFAKHWPEEVAKDG